MEKKIIVVTRFTTKEKLKKIDTILTNQKFKNFVWYIYNDKKTLIDVSTYKNKLKEIKTKKIKNFLKEVYENDFDFIVEIDGDVDLKKEAIFILIWNSIYSNNSIVSTSLGYDGLHKTISEKNIILIPKDQLNLYKINIFDKQQVLNEKKVNIIFSDVISFFNENIDNEQINLNNFEVYPKFEDYSVMPNEYIELNLNVKDKKQKTNVLFLFPWAIVGGADFFNLDMIHFLNKELYNIYIITTLPKDNMILSRFEKYAQEIYDLPTFSRKNNMPFFIRTIVENNEIDIIFVSNSTMGYSSLEYIKSIKPNIKVLEYIHNLPNPIEYTNPGFAEYSVLNHNLINETYTCNDVCTNQLKKFYGIENAQTVYIGVDHNKFNIKNYNIEGLKTKYAIPKEKKIISFMAYLNQVKRPHLFLEIAESYLETNKDVIFLLCGYGPEYESVVKKHKLTKNNDKIKILGYIENPSEIYAISNAILICSTTEGLTLTAYESCSIGTPVISGDIGGQKELVSNKTGKLVPYNPENRKLEIKNFVNAIDDVLAREAEIRNFSPKLIRTKFSIEKMGEKMNFLMTNISENSKTKALKEKGLFILNEYFNKYNAEYNFLVKEFFKDKNIIIEIEKNKNLKTTIKLKLKKLFVRYKVDQDLKKIYYFSIKVTNMLKKPVNFLVLILFFPIYLILGIIIILKAFFLNIKKEI